MIRFEFNQSAAEFVLVCGAEDGWVIRYDPERHKFLVWDSAEKQAWGQLPEEMDTLEQVYEAVASWT